MNVILLGLDLVVRDMSSTTHTDWESVVAVRDMKESCLHMMTVLEELLNADMIEAGILELDRTWICGQNFVSSCLTPLSRLVGVSTHF